jgi:peptidyl-prolyl cis-trans isomerase A (cyclophilin A)
MNVAATSGNVPGQFVTAASVVNRLLVATRFKPAICNGVNVVRPTATGPVTCTRPLFAMATLYGRMLPPMRPNSNPRCAAEPPADGRKAASATTASSALIVDQRTPAASLTTVFRTLAGVLVLSLALVAAGCGGGGNGAGPPAALLHPAKLTAKAPQLYTVKFVTTAGTFTIGVHRTWAPRGADRFYNLVKNHFYDGVTFFRVVPGFVVQFGISPFPAVSKAWLNATLRDDLPVGVSNGRGGVTFAAAGPNTRTTQVFINTGNNQSLDQQGFTPFGAVASGMDVVDKLYGGYADQPTSHQGEMISKGNAWLTKAYPKLDSIKSATVTEESNPALP